MSQCPALPRHDWKTGRLNIFPHLASGHPSEHRQLIRKRSLLELAQLGNESALAGGMLEGERLEKAADREYWAPLKRELEQLRLSRERSSGNRS